MFIGFTHLPSPKEIIELIKVWEIIKVFRNYKRPEMVMMFL